MPVYLGLDCGGSSSRALAVDGEGTIVHSAQSGSANLASTADDTIRRHLTDATRGCNRADFVCGCFAGLLTEDHRNQALKHLSDLYPGSRLRAEPDYAAALYACPTDTDVCVVAGTGSIVCSRHGSEIVRTGGRGFVLGDKGSAFQFGRDAIEFYLDHPSEVGSTMRKAVIDVFGSEAEIEIVGRVYRAQSIPSTLAKFLKPVGTDAKAGMPYAVQIVRQNLLELAHLVNRHVEIFAIPGPQVNVCLAGGVWQGGAIYKQLFEEALRAVLPTIRIRVSQIQKPPLQGAVELAKEMNGVHRVA